MNFTAPFFPAMPFDTLGAEKATAEKPVVLDKNAAVKPQIPVAVKRDFMPKNPAVAMAYVPYQMMGTLYEDEIGLEKGTLFPELDKPFYGKDAEI